MSKTDTTQENSYGRTCEVRQDSKQTDRKRISTWVNFQLFKRLDFLSTDIPHVVQITQ